MSGQKKPVQTRVRSRGQWISVLVVLLLGGCATIERCNQVGGLVYDVTTFNVSPNGELLAGGAYYELESCAFNIIMNVPLRGRPKGLLLVTSGDGGISWRAQKIPLKKSDELPKWTEFESYELKGLAAGNSGTLFAGINYRTQVGPFGSRNFHVQLLKSDDGGSTWTLASAFGDDLLLNIAKASNTTILASLCGQGILRTQDNGATWVPTGLTRADDNSCDSIKLTSNSSGEMYAYAWGRNGPGFYRSVDEGASWSRLPIPVSGRRAKIAANDKGDVVVSMSGPWQHEMHLSNDHGKTSRTLIPPYKGWTDQLAVTRDGVLLVKSMSNPLVPGAGSYISTDNGGSWARLPLLTVEIPGDDGIVSNRSGTLFARQKLDLNTVPSNAWGGTIYYSDDSGRSWHTINPLVKQVPE